MEFKASVINCVNLFQFWALQTGSYCCVHVSKIRKYIYSMIHGVQIKLSMIIGDLNAYRFITPCIFTEMTQLRKELAFSGFSTPLDGAILISNKNFTSYFIRFNNVEELKSAFSSQLLFYLILIHQCDLPLHRKNLNSIYIGNPS